VVIIKCNNKIKCNQKKKKWLPAGMMREDIETSEMGLDILRRK
jgi:hypothetical protein